MCISTAGVMSGARDLGLDFGEDGLRSRGVDDFRPVFYECLLI
jgi:hypothetical protein